MPGPVYHKFILMFCTSQKLFKLRTFLKREQKFCTISFFILISGGDMIGFCTNPRCKLEYTYNDAFVLASYNHSLNYVTCYHSHCQPQNASLLQTPNLPLNCEIILNWQWTALTLRKCILIFYIMLSTYFFYSYFHPAHFTFNLQQQIIYWSCVQLSTAVLHYLQIQGSRWIPNAFFTRYVSNFPWL